MEENRCGEPLRRTMFDVASDVRDIVRDFSLCFAHSGSLYVILIVVGLTSEMAIVVAATVGTQRVFSTETRTQYLRRTAQHCWCGWRRFVKR